MLRLRHQCRNRLSNKAGAATNGHASQRSGFKTQDLWLLALSFGARTRVPIAQTPLLRTVGDCDPVAAGSSTHRGETGRCEFYAQLLF